MKRIATFFLLLATCATARANLIQNAGFEAEGHGGAATALNWKMNEPDDHGDMWGNAIRMDWHAHEGRFGAAVRGTWGGAGDFGGFWQEAEIEAGRTYNFSVWLWADANWTAKLQEIKIEFWDVGRSQKLGEASNSFGDISEFWMEKSVQAIAPEGSFWARVVINVSGAGAGGALQADDAKLETAP